MVGQLDGLDAGALAGEAHRFGEQRRIGPAGEVEAFALCDQRRPTVGKTCQRLARRFEMLAPADRRAVDRAVNVMRDAGRSEATCTMRTPVMSANGPGARLAGMETCRVFDPVRGPRTTTPCVFSSARAAASETIGSDGTRTSA